VALGPIVGGVLLRWFWWGSVFLIGVPVMAVVLIAGPRLLPDPKDPSPGRLDPVSVVLSLTAILPFVYGLKELAKAGWHVPPAVALLVGVTVGVVFVLRQRRLASPLLDLRLFANRTVRGALLVALAVAAVQGGSGFFIAQYLQMVKGLSPLAAGLWTLVPTVALVFRIFASQGVAQRVRPAYVVSVGAVISATGMLTLTQINQRSSLAVLIGAITVVFVGISPVGPLVSQLVVPAVPPEKAGAASSLNATSGEFGIALGIAVLGSIGAAAYRSGITIPTEVAGAPAARVASETIGGAMAVARSLPPTVANALTDSARTAFTSGLNVAAAVCAVALVGLAMLVVSTLRHVEPLMAHPPGGVATAEQDSEQVPAGVS
jgi:DHA2 family multidrug resistance protein-like MFS transporter